MAKNLTYKQYKQMVEEQAQTMLDTLTFVATGNMDVEIKIPEGIDILTDLATGFSFLVNDMRGLLAQQEKTREELEKRVVERTAELEAALSEVQAIQKRYVRQQWTEYTDDFEINQTDTGADDTSVASAEEWLSTITQAVEQQETLTQTNGNSTLAVPINYGDELIGVLGFNSQEFTEWTTEDIAAVEAITEQVGLALENQRLFKQTQAALAQTEEQAQHLAALNEMSTQLKLAKSQDEILDIIARQIAHIVRSDRASIAWLNPNGDTLETLALQGEKGAIPTGAMLPIEGTAVGAAVQQKQMILVSDTANSEWVDSSNLGEQGLLSTICTPLMVGDEAIGTLNVGSYQLGVYTARDENLLLQTASMVASAIENQRLFEQVQQRASELEETTGFLNTIIDNIPSGLFVKDAKDLRFVQWNKAQEAIIGFNKETMLDKTDHDFFSQAEADNFVRIDREILSGGKLFDIPEEETQTANQETRILHTKKVPILGADGTPRYLLQISEDITEQKAADAERERLLAEVQRLAAIVENHPDFIGVGTMDGQALYINPAGLKMMGLPLNYDVTTMNVNHFYPPADVEILMKEGMPIALEKGSWSAEANLLRVDGSTVPVEETIGINYDANRNPHSFSITMRDITQRKQTEVEREQLLAEVEAAYRQFAQGEWEQFLNEQHQGNLHIEHQPVNLFLEQGSVTLFTEAEEQSKIQNPKSKIETAIALRGQSIGAIKLEDIDPNRKWTAEERVLVEAVSEQLAQTIENLRLFGNTQRRAAREQLTREIADKMRALPDVDSIVQVGMQELSKVLGGSHMVVELNIETDESGQESVNGNQREL